MKLIVQVAAAIVALMFAQTARAAGDDYCVYDLDHNTQGGTASWCGNAGDTTHVKKLPWYGDTTCIIYELAGKFASSTSYPTTGDFVSLHGDAAAGDIWELLISERPGDGILVGVRCVANSRFVNHTSMYPYAWEADYGPHTRPMPPATAYNAGCFIAGLGGDYHLSGNQVKIQAEPITLTWDLIVPVTAYGSAPSHATDANGVCVINAPTSGSVYGASFSSPSNTNLPNTTTALCGITKLDGPFNSDSSTVPSIVAIAQNPSTGAQRLIVGGDGFASTTPSAEAQCIPY